MCQIRLVYGFKIQNYFNLRTYVRREGFTPGNAILLFNVEGLETKWPTITSAPRGEMISEPKLTTYPGYGDNGEIRVLVSKFYDADGYILEVNQILSD